MPSTPDLRLDWCSYEAAKYAVEHWHYSRSVPIGKLVKCGVWEGGRFIGCVMFTHGANQYQGHKFGLTQMQVCELVRVALATHVSPVTRVVAIALRMLKRLCPGIRLVVSYADPEQGHDGRIYQAGNWIYVGTGGSQEAFYDASGKRIHSRVIAAGKRPKMQFGRMTRARTIGDVRRVSVSPKFKYLMPLDDEMRLKIASIAKPYPKRGRSRENAAALPRAEGGVIPTRPLQTYAS